MKSKIIVVFALLIFSLNINAYDVARHEITIQVNENSSFDVTEKYFLDFFGDDDLKSFKQKVIDNGPDFIAWKVFNPQFDFSIANNLSQTSNRKASFQDLDNKVLQLEYVVSAKFIEKELPRSNEYKLNTDFLSKFISGTSFIVPKNTLIKLIFPKQAIIQQLAPQGVFSGNEVVWQGYLVSNELLMSFEIKKPIAPPLSVNDIVQQNLSKQETLIFAIVLAIALLVIYFNRKIISEKIENYIIENSALENDKSSVEIKIK